MTDEFILFPSESGSSAAILDVGYSGSHGPRYLGGCGRQHRTTEPRETLRCSEVDDIFAASGPGREARLSVVSAPSSVGGPPGDRADGPGNLVNLCPRVGLESTSMEAAILRATPVLKNWGLSGLGSETQPTAEYDSGAHDVWLEYRKANNNADCNPDSSDQRKHYAGGPLGLGGAGRADWSHDKFRAVKSTERTGADK